MNKEFEKHKEAFLSEATAHLKTMNAALLKLEKDPNNKGYLHDIFRAMHTLKSMSAAMNLLEMAKFCHAIENLLDSIKENKIQASFCIDELFSCFDHLTLDLKNIVDGHSVKSREKEIKRLNNIIEKKEIDNSNTNEVNNNLFSFEKVKSIDVKVEKLDTLLNLVEELFINKMKLTEIKDHLDNMEINAVSDSMGRTINDLQYIVMKIRMVSVGFIFNQFPRMIRDLAKQQNKEINLVVEGEDIELDRSIIDEISESLIHLIRNAVSHGIETKEVRLREMKPPKGLIKITALRTKESVKIVIFDDGQGLNINEIKKTALRNGLIKEGDSEEKIIESIFSGVSTSQQVTDISGRGLGLDIVKKKIESINGSIQVKSESKQGTTFIINIPLSLAMIKALFIKVSGSFYAIPVNSIDRLIQINNENLKSVFSNETFILDNEDIPILRLKDIFKFNSNDNNNKSSIVVVKKDDEKIGLMVDELLSTQEIVIKPLNRFVKNSKYFSGSTILGSGDVMLILDIGNLLLANTKNQKFNRVT